MRPKEANYKTVIDAFARIRNPHKAQEVFFEMLQHSLDGNPDAKPGSDSCKALLASWLMSNAPDSIEKAIVLMDRIAEIDRSDTIDVKLDKDAYYLLFDICAKSKNQDITAGAETILRKMKDIHDEGRGAMKPDSRCYNIAINCWGKVGNAERAEALFWEMYNYFVENGNQDVKPDAFTVSTVLSAWSRSSNENATRRAQVFFERIQKQIEMGKLQIKLDSVCYASLLNCLANARTEEATETAEATFVGIQQRYRAGDQSVRPNEACYRAVVKCRTNIGNLDGAEKLIFEMNDLFRGGQRDLELKHQCCKIVLSEWLCSSDEAAPVRADKFLRWMNQNLRDNERTDALSYASTLRCWARSRRPDSGKHTENLLLEMVEKFGAQRPIVRGCFSDLVCAWARSDNVQRAEELLFRLCDDYLNKRTQAQPDLRAFVAVLAAISRAKPQGVGMRCLRVVQSLREIVSRDQKSESNRVLDCWNNVSSSDENRMAIFLAQMEEFDTPTEVLKASGSEEESADGFSLALKY